MKREIFQPIFMNFPVLDRFPFPSRTRARQLVNRLRHELRIGLGHSSTRGAASAPDGLGRRMIDARNSGQWNEKQLLDNLTVSFVAGQENPQLCMISTLYLLAKHPVSLVGSADSTSTAANEILCRTRNPGFMPGSGREC